MKDSQAKTEKQEGGGDTETRCVDADLIHNNQFSGSYMYDLP